MLLVFLTNIQIDGPNSVNMLGYASATTAKIFSYEGQPQLKIFKEVLGGYFFDSPGILTL